MHPDRLGHFEPSPPRRHADGEIGRADARRKAVQCAIRTGMRVRADRQHARSHKTELRQDDMLNAHATDLKVILDLVLFREVAHDLAESRRLDVLRRLEVIGHERNLLVVEHRAADAFELLDRRRRRDVIREHHVKLTGNQLSWLDMRKSCMTRENLLRHIHSHEISSWISRKKTAYTSLYHKGV